MLYTIIDFFALVPAIVGCFFLLRILFNGVNGSGCLSLRAVVLVLAIFF